MNALAILSERPFRLLWLARTVSSAGTAFSLVALAFAVLGSGGTATSLGLIMTAGILVRLLFLLVGGVWADRLPRRLVMMGADIARMLTQGTIAALLLTGRAGVWELLAGNVVVSGATAIFRPASTGLVAQTVDRARLQEANALLSVSQNVASFAGPALSGLIVATVGPGWSFAIDAGSYAASAVFLAAMPALGRMPAQTGRFLADLAAGWRVLIAHRWYWLNLVAHGLWNLGVATLFVLGPVIERQHAGGAARWGLISAGLSAGAVLGGLVAVRVKPRRPLLAGNLGLILGAAPLLALAWRLPLAVTIGAAAMGFAAVAFLNGLWLTAIQQLFPAAVLSRVSSYDNLISYAIMPLGYALAGPAAALAGVSATLLLSAAVMAVPCGAVAFMPDVRGLVRQPDGTIARPGPARQSAFAGRDTPA